MDIEYQITEIEERHLAAALSLVWNVFLEFEAPEYCEAGIAEFKHYIEPDAIRQMLNNGELKMWTCNTKDGVVGVIALRPPCHISLLFVDKRCHHQGIARALFEHMHGLLKENGENNELTVNSSPYAAGFYRRMGFADTDTEQTVNGIRFIPMKRDV